MLIYLIHGHSHNIADWIIVWCHNAMEGKNFYILMAIIKVVNQVKGVNTKFIDHREF